MRLYYETIPKKKLHGITKVILVIFIKKHWGENRKRPIHYNVSTKIILHKTKFKNLI